MKCEIHGIEMHKKQLSHGRWVYIVGQEGDWYIYWSPFENVIPKEVSEMVQIAEGIRSLAKCEAFCQELFGESEPE